MKIAAVILRILFGLIFLIFGLNLFLQFLPQPPMPPAAGEFFGALAKTGYFIPMLGATQVISGALLLTGIAVPLALVLLAPVIMNILLFHLFLAPDGLPLALIVVALEVILAWMHRDAYGPLIESAPSRT